MPNHTIVAGIPEKDDPFAPFVWSNEHLEHIVQAFVAVQQRQELSKSASMVVSVGKMDCSNPLNMLGQTHLPFPRHPNNAGV